jgi:hypothetical protein
MYVIKPTSITDSLLVSSDIPEDDYDEWSGTTSYTAGESVIVIATHKVYEALKSTLNEYPPDNLDGTSPAWLEVSPTNRWKMFDTVVGSQSEQSESIEVHLLTNISKALSLLNVEAQVVTIVVDDPTDGEVMNETYPLNDDSAVIDLYTYFFSPIVFATGLTVELPIYSSADLEIIIDNPSGTAKVGELVMGDTQEIGCTSYGASVGIQDYSVKELDSFGNYSILKRGYAKRGNFDISMKPQLFPVVLNLFTEYRAEPLVWVATDVEYLAAPLTIYGYVKDFSLIASYPTETQATLEIEGLI